MAKFIKQMMAEEMREVFGSAESCLVVGLAEIDAEKDVALRNQLREKGASFRVIHNRTSRHALDDAKKGLAEFFQGQTAIALVPGEEEPDMVSVAKALVAAAKEKTVELRGGYVDGELLDKAGFEMLALSPDKPTLRAMMLGVINGTARGLAASLSGVGGGIARCLQARIDKNGETPSE